MAIHDVVAKAQELILASVAKVTEAPEYPIFAPPSGLVCEALPTNIRISIGTFGTKERTFDLRLELVIPLTDIHDNHYFIDSLPEDVSDVFFDDVTIGGTCDMWEGEITSQLAISEIAGINVIGWIIIVPDISISGG